MVRIANFNFLLRWILTPSLPWIALQRVARKEAVVVSFMKLFQLACRQWGTTKHVSGWPEAGIEPASSCVTMEWVYLSAACLCIFVIDINCMCEWNQHKLMFSSIFCFLRWQIRVLLQTQLAAQEITINISKWRRKLRGHKAPFSFIFVETVAISEINILYSFYWCLFGPKNLFVSI